MNDKIIKQKMYTEFSIRLDKLEYKLDKLLVLMESKEIPMITAKPGHGPAFVEGLKHLEEIMICTACMLGGDREHSKEHCSKRPPQWSNESYVDYMKRIGELNTAQSDDEYFGEVYK